MSSRRSTSWKVALLAVFVLALSACQEPISKQSADEESPPPPPATTAEGVLQVNLGEPFTVPEVGAAQGLEWRSGRMYVYGDRTEGVIREYRMRGRNLEFTGNEIALTLEGNDKISHPTGLTWVPDLGTWIGDTVAGIGTIYEVDWEKLLDQESLDGSILREISDDLAVNGTRPEFVRLGERWFLATADYGDQRNAVRLYRPEALKEASKTSEAGVLAHSFACGPWVQSLYWHDESGILFLIQNQIEGLRWRLSLLDLERSVRAGQAEVLQVLDFAPTDELEGFHGLNPQLGAFVSSSSERNFYFADLAWKAEPR